ncbi:hypothetical protein SK069_08530 [Patulibacter brassicae]|uniref:ABC transporter permease subunit n=1 Tax=Patulibacter brassicae TaxID=1705717 RepID=A0ABU4VIW1_9ACTN|nr:hypothetical protein [Patulibacter brassicae]MDX8151634.1 hypothetical protein [Patulibacter brassicae]
MIALVRAETRRITGRRGSFWGGLGFVATILVIAVLANGDDGADKLEATSTIGRYAGLLSVVVMGALAGSYDTANGTMRYLVLTGVPRWQLAVVRLLGIMVTTIPMALLILVVALVTAGGSFDGTDVGNAVWATFSTLWVWGVVCAAIGMLLRSNGPAIAAGVVLFFGGSLITSLVYEYLSETVGNYLFPGLFAQVSELSDDDDFKISLAAAFVGLAVWIAAIVALAIGRVRRDEY